MYHLISENDQNLGRTTFNCLHKMKACKVQVGSSNICSHDTLIMQSFTQIVSTTSFLNHGRISYQCKQQEEKD